MDITVTPCSSIEEMVGALTPIWHYFGRVPTPDDAERFVPVLPFDRMLVARDGATNVGGAGTFPFELTVPGGMVKAAGTTVVGVLPTHRRRGILRSLMRTQLDDVHARHEPVAYLWASEETIYGRFGYGMAAWTLDSTIAKPAPFARPTPPRGDFRFLGEEEALEPFAAIYDRVRMETPGMFSRTESWWKSRRLTDPESRRAGAGILNRILVQLDGKPEGYALYRLQQSLEAGITSGYVTVVEAVAATPEANRELWRFLLDIDWVAHVKASLLPVDHPLLLLLARPRMAKVRMTDSLWVRLVDVRAALSARRFGAAEPVVIQVADAFCPWNEGVYRVGPSGVDRTSASPDLSVDVTALGSAYLGGLSFSTLASGDRVVELRPGAIARADVLFAAGRAPWCPEIF